MAVLLIKKRKCHTHSPTPSHSPTHKKRGEEKNTHKKRPVYINKCGSFKATDITSTGILLYRFMLCYINKKTRKTTAVSDEKENQSLPHTPPPPKKKKPTKKLFTTKPWTNMLLWRNQRFIFQSVGDDVAAHQFPPLVVKVVEERAKVLQGQQGQHVVVGVHRDLHQSHQLLRHHAAMLQAATQYSSISTKGTDVAVSRCDQDRDFMGQAAGVCLNEAPWTQNAKKLCRYFCYHHCNLYLMVKCFEPDARCYIFKGTQQQHCRVHRHSTFQMPSGQGLHGSSSWFMSERSLEQRM